MENWRRSFLKRLEQELASYREDSIFFDEEGSAPDTLRQLFDVGKDKAAPVVMDMAVFVMDEKRQMLQIFTEMALDIEEERVPGLLTHINALNMPVPIGAFGYYIQEHQLYHKYNLMVEEPEDMEAFVQKILDLLEMILNIIGNCYEELYAAAKGEE